METSIAELSQPKKLRFAVTDNYRSGAAIALIGVCMLGFAASEGRLVTALISAAAFVVVAGAITVATMRAAITGAKPVEFGEVHQFDEASGLERLAWVLVAVVYVVLVLWMRFTDPATVGAIWTGLGVVFLLQAAAIKRFERRNRVRVAVQVESGLRRFFVWPKYLTVSVEESGQDAADRSAPPGL